MNRTPTPTVCTLQLFMCNQCLIFEYTIFIHIHQTFTPRTPIMTRGCIYTIRADGRDESDPTPTVCALQLFMYNQCLFHEHVIFTHVHQTFYPRTPTVGADLSCPKVTKALYTKVWLSCNLH
ncbi:hypothetical protein [Prevotella pallens]